jgi:general secretion pathway protein M
MTMITNHPIDRYLTRYPNVAALVYVACMVIFFLISLVVVLNLVGQYRALSESADVLAWFEGRPRTSHSESGLTADAMPAGSPFLGGQTQTLASAALLQRVTGAVTRAGGNIVSSEVSPQGAQSKGNYVRVSVVCEIKQEGLQQLLYDIEAGMPFLFVNQLTAEAPPADSEGRAMRVVFGVSGLWSSEK